MEQCNKLNGYPKFKDGRMFCPDTLPQNQEATNVYTINCKCDKCPNGCIEQMTVFTDAVEAIRDNFWGRNCPDDVEHITIDVKKN